jgi:hypothetical protein
MAIEKEKFKGSSERLEDQKIKYEKLKMQVEEEKNRIEDLLDNLKTKEQVEKMKTIIKKHNRKKNLLKILEYNIKYKI